MKNTINADVLVSNLMRWLDIATVNLAKAEGSDQDRWDGRMLQLSEIIRLVESLTRSQEEASVGDHTTGPWRIVDDIIQARNSEYVAVILSANAELVEKDNSVLGSTVPPRTAKLNAALISAAPEMLEQLITLKSVLNITPAPDGWNPEWSEKLNNVLAKALGRAQ